MTEEIRTYYDRPVVKRPVWKWYVPAYFFTGGLAAGSTLVGAGARITGDHGLARRCLFSASAATTVSGVLLVADLGRPERFLNMLRVAKVTSPMSVGTWVLTAFGAATTAATACELLAPAGRLERAADVGARRLGRAGEGLAALLAPVMATYTAVLIADTAVPAWHEGRRELPFVFAGGAAASSGALALLLDPGDRTGPPRRVAVGGAVLELVAGQVMKRRTGDVGEAYRRGGAGVLGKVAAASTIAGIAGVLLARGRRPAGTAGAVLLLAGAAAERFAVFHAGIESADDPAFTVGPQRRRRDREAAPSQAQGRAAAGAAHAGADHPG